MLHAQPPEVACICNMAMVKPSPTYEHEVEMPVQRPHMADVEVTYPSRDKHGHKQPLRRHPRRTAEAEVVAKEPNFIRRHGK